MTPHHGEILFRLLLAAVLGALVGFEREVHGRPAGIRTYLILCLGSALVMVLSQYLSYGMVEELPADALRVDPGRIAAQALTGIGFLGAGVILRYKDTIRGLTTAACVWVVCAIGLAIGAGFYLYGSVVAFLTVFSLVGIKFFEKRLKKDWYQEMTIVSQDLAGQFNLVQDIITRTTITSSTPSGFAVSWPSGPMATPGGQYRRQRRWMLVCAPTRTRSRYR